MQIKESRDTMTEHEHNHEHEALEEVTIVTLTDANGDEKDYQEYQRIELAGKTFALLDEVTEDEDGDSVIARIDTDDGQEVYVAPTDEEFDAARARFEALFAED